MIATSFSFIIQISWQRMIVILILKNDRSNFYLDVKEDIPRNIPEPRCRPIYITVFVDAGHTGDGMTRCSGTDVLLYVDSVPVIWYSKLQNLIETSNFGSEFNAL